MLGERCAGLGACAAPEVGLLRVCSRWLVDRSAYCHAAPREVLIYCGGIGCGST